MDDHRTSQLHKSGEILLRLRNKLEITTIVPEYHYNTEVIGSRSRDGIHRFSRVLCINPQILDRKKPFIGDRAGIVNQVVEVINHMLFHNNIFEIAATANFRSSFIVIYNIYS